MNTKIVTTLSFLVGLMLVGAGCSFGASTNPPGTTSTSGGTPTTTAPCDGCISEVDNGKTFSVKESDRLSVSLATATYNRSSLVVSSTAGRTVLSELASDQSATDRWVRSFVAVATGTAQISVRPHDQTGQLFNITVQVTPKNPATTTTTTTADTKSYRATAQGVSFNYPSNIFTVTRATSSVNLASKFYVDDNPSGIPGNEIRHPFAMRISTEKKSLLTTLEASPYGALFTTAFTSDDLNSFQPIPGFAEAVTVAGKKSYAFTVGAEGINKQYIYIPRLANTTIVVEVDYIGDALSGSIRPSRISEADQKKYVKAVLDSLAFL